MKKTKLLLALLATGMAASLVSCGNKGGGVSEHKISGDLESVDSAVAQIVKSSAIKNIANFRYVVIENEQKQDYSGVYAGSLAPYNETIYAKGKVEIKVSASQLLVQETASGTTEHTKYGGAKSTEEKKIEMDVWMGSYTPTVAGDTNDHATYLLQIETLNGQQTRTGQTMPFTATSEETTNLFYSSLTSQVFQTFADSANSGSVYKKGSDYVLYASSSSTSSLLNPAYPSDTTKAIGLLHQSALLITLNYKEGMGYYGVKAEGVTNDYALRGFDEEADYSSPICLSSTVSTVSFGYDEQTGLVVPQPYVTPDEKLLPALLTYDPTGTTQQSMTVLSDVTQAYKAVNPNDTSLAVYHAVAVLSSSNIYSFTRASGDAQPMDGYSAVKGRFGTIKAVKGLDKFFGAANGQYDIYAFVKNGEMSYEVTFD